MHNLYSLIDLAFLLQSLKKIFFKWIADTFEPSLLKSLPKNVFSVDFDGELYFRGKTQFPDFGGSSWLPEAENMFKQVLIILQTQ